MTHIHQVKLVRGASCLNRSDGEVYKWGTKEDVLVISVWHKRKLHACSSCGRRKGHLSTLSGLNW